MAKFALIFFWWGIWMVGIFWGNLWNFWRNNWKFFLGVSFSIYIFIHRQKNSAFFQNKKIRKKWEKETTYGSAWFFLGAHFCMGGKTGGKSISSVISTNFPLVGGKNCQLGKKSQNWGEKNPYFLTKSKGCVTYCWWPCHLHEKLS